MNIMLNFFTDNAVAFRFFAPMKVRVSSKKLKMNYSGTPFCTQHDSVFILLSGN